MLTDVAPDSPVMHEEIFGPILPVVGFRERSTKRWRFLRDRPTPLALYLFTRDAAIQEHVLDDTRSGGVCLNDTITHMLGQELPFGGLGESGIGRLPWQGRVSMPSPTDRSVLTRSLALDPKMRYPPPKFSLEVMKRAMRFLLGG
jgi:aldehyde dehydrogenase (NAD+)